MHQQRIVLLIAILAVSGLIPTAGCSRVNHDPVLTGITATPSDNVTVGSAVTLTATATDEDGDVLIYEWSATGGGTLSQSSTNTVVWTAPADPVSATVSCRVSDGRSGEASASKALTASVIWQFADITGYTPDSTTLPANSTTYALYTLDEEIPDNAVVDSVFITTDIEPDDEPEFFQVWLVTPAGVEYLVYDGINGEPDVDDLKVEAAKDVAAKGNWRLKVTRGNATIERYAEECEIEVYYRFY